MEIEDLFTAWDELMRLLKILDVNSGPKSAMFTTGIRPTSHPPMADRGYSIDSPTSVLQPSCSFSNVDCEKAVSVLDLFKGKYPLDPTLPSEIEDQIVNWATFLNKISCVTVKAHLGQIAKELLENQGLYEVFPGKNLPTKSWISRFILRHPELPPDVLLSGSPLSRHITPDDVDKWVSKLRLYLQLQYNINTDTFLSEKNAQSVFCCHEVGSIIKQGQKGAGHFVYKVSRKKSESRSSLTVYSCESASNVFLKPLFVLKTDSRHQVSSNSLDKNVYLSYSKEGIVTGDILLEWMHVMDEELDQKGITRPVLILLDASVKHVSIALTEFCKRQKIILFNLLANSLTVKIPFGLDIYYHLNSHYELLSSYIQHKGVTKLETVDVLGDSWVQMLSAGVKATEFRDLGILPLNPALLKGLVTGHGSLKSESESEKAPLTDSSPIRFCPTRRTTRSSKRCNSEPSGYEAEEFLGKSVTSDSNHKAMEKFVPLDTSVTSSDRLGTFSEEKSRPNKKCKTVSCNNCEYFRAQGILSGISTGLSFALERVETILRDDMLALFKSRYSSHDTNIKPYDMPYLMWQELKKCLELGPSLANGLDISGFYSCTSGDYDDSENFCDRLDVKQ